MGIWRTSLDFDGVLERVVAEDVGATGLPLACSFNDSGSVDSMSFRRGIMVGLSGPEPKLKDAVDSRPSCTPGAGSLDRRTAYRLSKDIARYSHHPPNLHKHSDCRSATLTTRRSSRDLTLFRLPLAATTASASSIYSTSRDSSSHPGTPGMNGALGTDSCWR